MDSATYNKIKYEKRKDGTIVVVSGDKTWYSFLGYLPVEENGVSLLETVTELKQRNKRLEGEIAKLRKQFKTQNDVLIGLIEDIKKQKESDGL